MSQLQPPPSAEVTIDEALIRQLLNEQMPELAQLPLQKIGEGWDNAIYRLGEDLLIRLPRRQAAVELMENEQRWLPELARHLPIAVPAAVRIGQPSKAFKWPFSICPYFEGEPLLHAGVETEQLALDLGRFFRALHLPAPKDAPSNAFRGIPLAERKASLDKALITLGHRVDAKAIGKTISELFQTPAHQGPPFWLHGDVHPLNLLAHNGRLSAVIDFGDICAGDPASDLAVAWMLFDEEDRHTFFKAAAAEDTSLQARARGWAIALGAVYAATAKNDPTFERLGLRTIQRGTYC